MHAKSNAKKHTAIHARMQNGEARYLGGRKLGDLNKVPGMERQHLRDGLGHGLFESVP